MAGIEGQIRANAERLSTAIGNSINAVVGSTATVLTPPGGTRTLVMKADVGPWRIRIGSVAAGMPAAVDPTASVNDGTAGWKLLQGQELVLEGVKAVTVKAYNATDALTYYWL